MEHWEALSPDGLRFVYDDALFPPGTDSFLLSAFPRLKPRLRVCDLGCGTGLLGLLLLQRQRDLSLTGVELSQRAAALAAQAVAANALEDRFTVHCGDLRDLRPHFPTGSFDLVVCNPPYYPAQSGKVAAEASIRAARAELTCTLEEVCQSAAYLLRWGGSLCLVHKPERLADLLVSLRTHKIEPKRLRLVQKDALSGPSLVLVEGRRGGKSGLTVEPPLLLQTAEGRSELDAIYFRKEETP